ncbi:AEC family transporter [Nocardioides panacis]|uniref:AEC family transporter n=1 Tax=Nocardioides panacis TaxID=2849501 RepID=A0A975Y082_9ACTN|nr:AEC family transporter [Nocardioides panacis]QWZ08059.1 AEC family transporter [Nocardioides panacis]
MQGVFEGFATIGAIIALGVLLAQLGVLDLAGQQVLSRLSFFVASPALMVTVLGRADVTSVLSKNLVATAAGVLVCGVLYLLAARLVWHHPPAETTIGTLSATYVNAGNLGLPIAAYVLGDAALVAPTLLMQLLVLQPVALAVLDNAVSARRFSWVRAFSRPLTNPLTLGSLLGLALAVTGVSLPMAVQDPLELVGGMAVPSMLIAYGISLRLGPRPGHGTSAVEIGFITVLKLVVQPAAAYGVARLVLGLDGTALLAVTVLAALPTAQNIFVHATRYGRGVVLARDSIFVTTVLSVPAIALVAALLG